MEASGIIYGAIAAVTVGCAVPALAQTSASGQITPPGSSNPGAATQSTNGAPESALEEVVVTATKRQEPLQKVPLAVTVINGADVGSLGITNSRDLVVVVPNMSINYALGPNSPQYNLRGIGTNDAFATSAASVGVYFDDVYSNNIFGQTYPLFDLQRVEVLRGPEGTLWGKNTTAGAINFISQAPENTAGGYADITYGNFNTRRIEGAVGGPLIDGTLSARVSFYDTDRDGLYFNTARDNYGAAYQESAVRAQFLWTPTNDFSARLILSTRKENDTQYFGEIGLLPGGVNTNGYKSNLEELTYGNDEDSPESVDDYRATLRADWLLGYGLTLTSITGYVNTTFDSQFDVDSTPASIFAGEYRMRTGQTSEEIRLSSASTQPFRWLIGGYFLDEDLNLVNPDISPPFPGSGSVRLAQQNTKSVAGFGHLEYDLTDALQVRAGARYTSEAKHMNLSAENYTAGTDPFNLAQATDFVPFDQGNVSHTDNQLTWDGTVEYSVSPGKMVYVRVATGFKASVFNTAVFGPGGFDLANPEHLTDYEVGLKTSWLNDRLIVNANAFDYDYKDYQISLLLNSTTLATIYSNAPKAEARGGEVEFVSKLTEHLTLKLNGGYTDAKFTDFPNASVDSAVNSGLPLNADGQRLPMVPEGTASFLAEYVIPDVAGGDVRLITDWSYLGRESYALWTGVPTSELTPQAGFAPLLPALRSALTEGGHTLGNFQMAYDFGATHQSEVALWVNNATNKFYRTDRNEFDPLDGVGFQRGDPRMYGITVRYKF